MLSKIETSKELLGQIEGRLECPICKTSLVNDGNSLKCESSHTFNISKKGTVVLQSKSKIYTSDLYTRDLFLNRREVINVGLYERVYDEIEKEIKSVVKSGSVVIDLGSGEGSHLKKIKERLDEDVVGVALDISKPAIELASDYLPNGILPIVADTNNLFFKDNSVDVALDFLSPLMIKETMRVLKHGGILVKVIPNVDYLKEIRGLIGESEYTKLDEVISNIKQKVKIEKIINVRDEKQLDEKTKKSLLKMTPLTLNKDIDNIDLSNFNTITIDLVILIIRKGENEI